MPLFNENETKIGHILKDFPLLPVLGMKMEQRMATTWFINFCYHFDMTILWTSLKI